jgi:TIR domain
MAGKIFISYRRDDDPSAAARVNDALGQRFGKANLFIDVDNLFAGQRFDKELENALSLCDVLIVIMGPRWLELLKAKSSSGERDYVREEISGALQRGIVIIPARIGRKGQLPPLPHADDLPADLKDLVGYQKHDITHERFRLDIAELIKAITTVRRTKRFAPARRLKWALVGAAVVFGGTVIISGHYRGLSEVWPLSIAASTDLFGSARAYTKAGNFACFGGAEYPDSWRDEAPLCLPYGCNFGKMSQDACLSLGAKKHSKTVIHGIKDSTRANECWLQQSCGDLRQHGEFVLFRL